MTRLVFLCLAACGGLDEAATSRCGATHALVDRVIDGDTIVLTTGEKVRYLLVNANEVASGKSECFGPEARTLNQSLVEGQMVDLSYGSECTDRYGRLLAFVSVDGRDLSSLLVERGYACVQYIPPDGMERRAELEGLQASARAARAGMWGACAEVPCAN